jgi:branched-chain amino acid transport system ATP-binding protein
MKTLLTVSGLVKRFGGIHALNGVDMHLDRGELVGIIGPNGSGKTTLFNTLTGIYRPDRGGILFEGKSLVGLPPHRISHLGFGRTFQNIRLFREMTVLDNIRAAHHRHLPYGMVSALCRTGKVGRAEKELREAAEEFLVLFGLEGRRDDLARNLPYGEQRKLEIARALASRPKILLLDEPAAGMNPSEVSRLRDFILEIREKFRLSILLIEHQMRLVMGISERIVVMDFGQVIARGRPEEIRKDERVLAAYLGRGDAGTPGNREKG